jgi:flagellar hook assembly protein FlgD
VPERPLRFALGQNAPNPFNPVTTIEFTLPHDGDASLKVFDLRGRLVRTLFDGPQFAGARTVEWNGRDASGARVASGVYLYRLLAGNHVEQRKMTLLK